MFFQLWILQSHLIHLYHRILLTKEKDLIKEDGTIDPQGVDYSLITPLLVKSIQELKAEIEELKQIVATK